MMAALLGSAALAMQPAAAKPAPKTSVTDIDPQALDDARVIIATIVPPERQAETFGTIVNTIMTQMRANATRRAIDPGLKAVIDEFLDTIPERLTPVTERHLPKLLDAMARAYTREFTPAELAEIRTFAGTPVGTHYLSRSAMLMADPEVAEANGAYARDAMEVAATLRPELLAKVNAYITAHPEALTRPDAPASAPSPSTGR